MQAITSKLTKLRQQPLAGVPFWLFLVVWGFLEFAWRWRRLRARI